MFTEENRPVYEKRFWEKVKKAPGTLCWVWDGARMMTGYGYMGIAGKRTYAHRISWALANGPIPSGRLICHKCDNPKCVRPDHLYAGTQAENMRDVQHRNRFRNGRRLRGEDNNFAKLKEGQVVEIRTKYMTGHTQQAIAEEYGITQTGVSRIVRFQTWKNVGR